MKNFTEWMMTKNFNYFFETKNPEKYINKKYHSFYLEQGLQLRFVSVDQSDIDDFNISQRIDQRAPLTPKDFYGKIIGGTVHDMLAQTRSDSQKYQIDVRKLQPIDKSVDDRTNSMTMDRKLMAVQVPIIIMSLDGEKKFLKNTTLAQQSTINDNSYVIMRQQSFEDLPTPQNPLGKLKQEGIRLLAHELGHAAQRKLSRDIMIKTGDPVLDATFYLTKDSELGTRLAMLKNLNGYNNIRRIGKEYFKGNEDFLNAFADNNKQNDRFNIIVSLLFDNDDGKSAIQQMINKYPDLQGADVNQISKTMESFMDFLRRTPDLDELFDAIELVVRTGAKEFAKEIRDKLIYGYPRVAFGNQPSGNQQKDIQTT